MTPHNTMRPYRTAVTIILLVTLTAAALIAPVTAQQGATTPTPSAPISFTGVIQSIGTDSIVVNGLPVNLTAAGIAINRLQVGTVVTVTGSLENGIVLASGLILGTPTVAATSTVIPTPRGDDRTSNRSNDRTSNRSDDRTSSRDDARRPRIVVEGPVRQINVDSIQVFDLTIQVAPNNPTRNRLRVGDFVRVEGDFNITNNTFVIVAVNISIININLPGRDSRDSVISNRNSNRSGGQVAPPPPPPPPPPPSSGRSSRSSRSS